MVRRPQQPRRDRRLQSRREQERRKQRLIITVGVVIVVLALAIPAFGYYVSFIRPPRTVAAKVGNTVYTMGDLVKQLRVQQAQGLFAQDPTAMASAPMDALYNTVQKELVRQGALKLGITVAKYEVDQVIHDIFYPKVPEGQQVEPSQLEKEYEGNIRSYLTQTKLSRKELEKSIEYSIYQQKLRDLLGKQVPSVADQVEVSWIRVADSTAAAAVQDRFKKGESFASIASTDSTETTYANSEGYVGWVPKGAFPELDATLFAPAITDIVALEGDKNDVLQVAASVAANAQGTTARAIINRWRRDLAGGTLDNVSDFTSIADNQFEATFNGHRILLGDRKLMEDRGISLDPALANVALLESQPQKKSVLFFAQDGKVTGLLALADTLKYGEVSGPITTTSGVYFVRVDAGPEPHDVTPTMIELLKNTALNDWVQNEWAQASQENRLAINFNSDWYAWIVKQLNISAPPVTPTPAA